MKNIPRRVPCPPASNKTHTEPSEIAFNPKKLHRLGLEIQKN
jgi:hypothetical protein